MADDGETLLELDLGRRRRVPVGELEWEVIRPLVEGDLPALREAPPPPEPGAVSLRRVHSRHHQLAMELAKGMTPTELALRTGYSPGYICGLQHDPTFDDLVTYYRTQREQIFVDTLERMRALGVMALEELQDRLERDPEGWTKNELIDLADKLLAKPMARGPGQGGSGAGAPVVQLNVEFVQAAAGQGPGQIIEAQVRAITEEPGR